MFTFLNIPGSALSYSVLGQLIFAGFTVFAFQRLRTNADIATADLGGVDLVGHLKRLPDLPAELLQAVAPVRGLASSRYPGLSRLTRMLSGRARGSPVRLRTWGTRSEPRGREDARQGDAREAVADRGP
jgi:hypothetical protein